MSDVKVPEMGESIVEGTIAKWHVKEGDSVNQGAVLAELETDKVNIEISAEESGIVEQINRQEGETVGVGETIARIGISKGTAAPERGKPDSAGIGKEDADAPSERLNQGAQAAASPKESAPTQVQPKKDDEAGDFQGTSASYNASPGARKLAREKGIDLGRIQSQDPMGRIRQEDVEAYKAKPGADGDIPARPAGTTASERRPNEGTGAQVKQTPAVMPGIQSGGDPAKPVDRRKMSRRRITIASRLVEAQRTAAMLTTFNEVDMTAILDIRKRRKQAFQEKHGIGLGFMSFFTKAVVGALKEFPLLNAEIQGDEIVVKQYYDIGIAVSAKEGLVVPVVRNADRLTFSDIEKQISGLAEKARSNSLALADLQGGTFTITNGGVFGSLLSTPILNAPQVGILGMHKIQLRPVAIDAERMENRHMMYVALSYDHRIVDGAEAVRFLVTLKQLLEDPESLLLEG